MTAEDDPAAARGGTGRRGRSAGVTAIPIGYELKLEERNGRTYVIGRLPERKRLCLYLSEGNGGRLTPLAYFNDDDEAREFAGFLERMANGAK